MMTDALHIVRSGGRALCDALELGEGPDGGAVEAGVGDA